MNFSIKVLRPFAAQLGRLSRLVAINALLVLSVGCSSNEMANDPMLNVQTASSHSSKGLLASVSSLMPITHVGQPITVQFELTNNTNASLSVLSWGTPLEGEFTREIFKVTRNAQAIRYMGRQVKRGSPSANDFVTIMPGESIQAQIDLRKGYQIDEVGEYLIALNLKYLTTQAKGNDSLQAVISGDSISVTVKP